jgi:hypothetical protein
MVFVSFSPVSVTFAMVFVFPTMVIIFSTLVFGVYKMLLSLDHIFFASETGFSITEKTVGEAQMVFVQQTNQKENQA